MECNPQMNARQELKLHKVEREMNLFERKSNIINHAFTHKCSGYCEKRVSRHQLYNPSVHKDSDFDGVNLKRVKKIVVQVTTFECRLGFEEQLKYENESGENNITRGKAPVRGEA